MKLAPALIFSTTRCAPSHSVRDEPDAGALTQAGVFPASPFVLKMVEKQIKTSRKGAPIRRPASVIFTSDKLYKVRTVACACLTRVNRILLRLSSNTASTRSSGPRRRTRVWAHLQCGPLLSVSAGFGDDFVVQFSAKLREKNQLGYQVRYCTCRVSSTAVNAAIDRRPTSSLVC